MASISMEVSEAVSMRNGRSVSASTMSVDPSRRSMEVTPISRPIPPACSDISAMKTSMRFRSSSASGEDEEASSRQRVAPVPSGQSTVPTRRSSVCSSTGALAIRGKAIWLGTRTGSPTERVRPAQKPTIWFHWNSAASVMACSERLASTKSSRIPPMPWASSASRWGARRASREARVAS